MVIPISLVILGLCVLYISAYLTGLLAEFAEPSVESYGVKPIKLVTQTSSVKISKPVKENNDAPLIKDCESKREDEVESPPEIERKIVKPNVDKVEVDIPKQNDKPARRPVKYAEIVPRNQENRTKNQETTRRIVNVEDTSSKAMVVIDGAGFDWSYMTDDEAPTNTAFMAFSDSE
nr:hypothetical protein [Tanacetum cinerariifolium]